MACGHEVVAPANVNLEQRGSFAEFRECCTYSNLVQSHTDLCSTKHGICQTAPTGQTVRTVCKRSCYVHIECELLRLSIVSFLATTCHIHGKNCVPAQTWMVNILTHAVPHLVFVLFCLYCLSSLYSFILQKRSYLHYDNNGVVYTGP